MLELWQEGETGNEHDFSYACQLPSLNETFYVFSGQRKPALCRSVQAR